MYSQLDLELVRIFGTKELTEGCWINLQDEDDYDDDGHICKLTQPSEYDEKWYYLIYPHTPYWATDSIHIQKDKDSIFEILWHIPHLEDVFRVAEEKNIKIEIDTGFKYSIYLTVDDIQRDIAYNFSSTLLEQSEETKQALISLFEQWK